MAASEVPAVPQTLGQRAIGPARQDSLRRHNYSLVLREIAGATGVSRAEVAASTGLTKGTVSTLVDGLIDARLVRELAPERGVVGRPRSPLVLEPDGTAGIGIEINVDYLAACVVDLTGAVRRRWVERGDNRDRGAADVLSAAAVLGRRAVRAIQREGFSLAGVGVAVPGVVDARGILRIAPNLNGWVDIDVAGYFASRLAGAVRVDNEANLGALGELWFGDHDGADDFLYVSASVGIGAGIVVSGRLFRGANGFAGEIGHVPVDPAGPVCACGSRGCLERLAGSDAILAAAGVADGDALVAAAERGDADAVGALRSAGRILGTALAGVLQTTGISVIVLGGLYAAAAPWFAAAVTDELRSRVITSSWSPVRVLVSRLPGDAAVRGAAGQTLQAVLDDPVTHAPLLLA